MGLKLAQFCALVLTAVAQVPAGTHFFELPNKIHLAQEQYFTVQQIYRGWALFGVMLLGALTANLLLTMMLRDQRGPFWLILASVVCLAGSLVIFFVWTYPANQATSNWTMVPTNWRALRAQWEYSHAASAVVTFMGLCALALSIVMARP
jgi:hypothetical protein